jgi:hypothetical protein
VGKSISVTPQSRSNIDLVKDHPDLRVYYKTTRPASATRTATRSLPASTNAAAGGTSNKKPIGAIAGGVVGGLAALIIVLCLILFCLHRLKKAKKEPATDVNKAPLAPPAELAVTPYPHEMSTMSVSKYVAVNEQSVARDQHGFSVHAPYDSQATPYNDTPSYPGAAQSYHSPSPHATRQHSSPQDPTYSQPSQSPSRSPYNEETSFADSTGAHQGSWSQQASPHIQQRQQSYPTPLSPQRPGSESVQQHPQLYHQPPEDALRHPQPSRHVQSTAGHGDGPAGTQYSDETQQGYAPSATATPAHFYPQPMSARGPVPGESAEYR